MREGGGGISYRVRVKGLRPLPALTLGRPRPTPSNPIQEAVLGGRYRLDRPRYKRQGKEE